MSKAEESRPEEQAPEYRDDDAPGIARRLLKGVSALFLIALMAGAGHLLLRLEPVYLPVRVISVEGEVHRLPLRLLQDTVSDRLDGGILTQDLVSLKAAVEELVWVHTAGVRRIWPDRLVISVYEHEPVARWGEDALVTAAGIVFRPDREEIPKGLPGLGGAQDQAPLVTRELKRWRPRFEREGLSILDLRLDPRGAWTLQTDAGFVVLLGTQDIGQRMDRFLRAYPAIAEAGRPERVDMRYSNGLAVSWMGVDQMGLSADERRAGVRHDHSVAGVEQPPVGAASSEFLLLSRPSALGLRPSRS